MSALEALLGAHVFDKQGKKVSVREISESNDVIVFYEEHRAAGRKFEVVFVSSDRDASSWEEYFNEMPWLALPFEDRQKKEELSKKYSVRGIPTLIVLDAKTGQVITSDGRSRVVSNPQGFAWN